MKNTETTQLMLDLETMGTNPTSAIIAIGAVKFDHTVPVGQEVILDRFQTVVSLKSSVKRGLTMDPSTVLWWMKQSDEARKVFEEQGQDLFQALCSFTEWVGGDVPVWGNGSDFDNVVLKNAYFQCGLREPWSYYNNRCYRTVKNQFPEIALPPRVGVFHNAVDDAETQALHLVEILRTIRDGGPGPVIGHGG